MTTQSLPMMPFFTDSFLGATTGWKLDEVGLYLNLLCVQWSQGGLPRDEENLTLCGRCTAAGFATAWPRVSGKFALCEDGLLRNERMEQHRGKALKMRIVRAVAGKEGGKAKAKKLANGVANGIAKTRILSPTPTLISNTNSNKDISTASPSQPVPGPVERVFVHWQTVHNKKRSALDDKRRRIIVEALKRYDEATLCQSIAGILNSPHHMGQNDRQTKYVDIEHCIGSAKRVDHGLECYERPPRTDLTAEQMRNRVIGANWLPRELRNASK